jgi:hypothetical protein
MWFNFRRNRLPLTRIWVLQAGCLRYCKNNNIDLKGEKKWE